MNSEHIKNIMQAWKEVVEKKTLDPVDHKALKGKHADRKDKDIDNDGDVDSSDEYLHKRRKAVSKSMKNESEESGEMKPCPKCDGSTENHDPDCPMTDTGKEQEESSCGTKRMKKESADVSTKEVDKALTHDCAKHVTSEQWGFGECIAGEHTLVEQEDGSAIVTHYDVMFEHGIERDVPVEKLRVLVSEAHKHTSKKEGAMKKESVAEGTVAQFEEEIETSYQQRSKGIRGALEQMWEAAVQAKQGGAGKPQETMKDKFKGKGAQDMAKDADMDNPEMVADDEQGHVDATQAGRVTKQAPTRGGEKRIGDKNIVNPVAGAVTKTTGKE